MGWTFNTTNPDADTNAPTIAAVGIVFTALSLLTVLLRCYVRVFMIRKFGADDYTIVVTWFCSLGFTIVTIMQSKWGLGLQNLDDMPLQNIYNFGLLQYAGAPFYISSILGFKLSLLFSFYRIAIQRAHRISIIVIMVAVTAFHFCFFVAQLNLCTPAAKQWDPSITGGNCLPAVPFYTSMASLTIMFDVVIMILPFPVLLTIQIPSKKKIILACLFSLGAFITIIQIIRIQTIHSLQNYLDSSMLIMWSMVETNLGITIASIPPLSPLIHSFRDKSSKAGSSNGIRSGGDGGGGGGGGSNGYALGSMGKSRDGRLRLGSAQRDERDRGLRGGEEGKSISHTTVKTGSLKHGDGSSEEFIIGEQEDGSGDVVGRGKGRGGGIRTTTEVRIERHDQESAYIGPRSGGGDPFADRETGVAG